MARHQPLSLAHVGPATVPCLPHNTLQGMPLIRAMALRVPDFLLRKLYRRGSLRETADGRFGFVLQNPLGTGTVVGPPQVVVNGIAYKPEQVQGPVDLAAITPAAPFLFRKGDRVDLSLPGRLLRGGNRIHITVPTLEFGEVELYVEDKEAEYCEIPGLPRPTDG